MTLRYYQNNGDRHKKNLLQKKSIDAQNNHEWANKPTRSPTYLIADWKKNATWNVANQGDTTVQINIFANVFLSSKGKWLKSVACGRHPIMS